MPIRNLEKFIENTPRALHPAQPIAQLQGTRLGIDATHWLKALINDVKDPTRDIDWFKLNKITPLVVFSGLSPRSKTSGLFASEHSRAEKRKDAWACYTRGQIGSAHVAWNATQASFADMQPAVMALLTELGVEFIRAPYASWGQLAYFVNHPAQPVHALYAGLDLLMFDGVDRLITKIDTSTPAASGTFTYVDKSSFLATIGLSKSQFLDACILAGFDWISTYDPLVSDPSLPFSWPTLISLLVGSQTGISLVTRLGEPNDAKQRYMDDYARIRCAVRHHLVLSLAGAVEPLNKEAAPIDLHDVFGHRLPAHVYWHLAMGHVSAGLISPLLWTSMPEFAPACGGETSEYQDHVAKWATVRALASAVACRSWEVPYWRTRKVTAVAWFAPDDEKAVDLNALPKAKVMPVNGGGSEWRVSMEWIDRHIGGSGGARGVTVVDALPGVKGAAHAIDLVTHLRALTGTDSAARETVGADRVKAMKPAQLAATLAFKLLELRGFIDPESHRPTTLGHALLDAAAALQDPTFQEPLVLAMELVRDGHVHARPYSKQYHVPPPAFSHAGLSSVPTAAAPHVLVLTRLGAALEPVFVRSGTAAPQWKPELDRDQLAVASLYKHTARTLHGVCEGILLHYAPASAGTGTAAATATGTVAAGEVAAKLPFALMEGGGGNKTAAMGILVSAYLAQVLAMRERQVPEQQGVADDDVRGKAEAYIVARFGENIVDPRAEIDRVRRFVKVVSDVVVPRMTAVVDKDVARQVRDAVAWWDALESGKPAVVVAVKSSLSPGKQPGLASPVAAQQQIQQQQVRQKSPVETKPASPGATSSSSPTPAPIPIHAQQPYQPSPTPTPPPQQQHMHHAQQYPGAQQVQGPPQGQQHGQGQGQYRTGSGSGRSRGGKRTGGRR
ncbi:hypothetical protein BCR44DRAFT_1515036 [Catenaria anguillulae PL171]|uniref:Temperature dependent protein affecting M2 dsRNA replication-domain-containing protein n=1 Tax=Catenaria anguillulae PL171 TaxID=765915 RepID=A0A1Y2HEV3_9FUNG|nr:hypothetical protein BCR44DRAFT_1515036 [Catenaria anguillulae PL171]